MAIKKRGVTVLICFRKMWVPKKGGFPQKRRVPTMEETMGRVSPSGGGIPPEKLACPPSPPTVLTQKC